VLIRHGQTAWNKSGKYQGQSDVALSEEGLEQARCLAEHFPVEKLDAVYASDLSRAMVTAETVAQKFGLEVRPEAAFRELSFGKWEGLTYAEIVAGWPEAMACKFSWRASTATIMEVLCGDFVRIPTKLWSGWKS
jgi:alpha-ribazole phosphatase